MTAKRRADKNCFAFLRGRPYDFIVPCWGRTTFATHERNVDFGLILVKYGLERILFRLSRSRHRDVFMR
jgi:hypothetical protein